jgi:hypothetical protein
MITTWATFFQIPKWVTLNPMYFRVFKMKKLVKVILGELKGGGGERGRTEIGIKIRYK